MVARIAPDGYTFDHEFQYMAAKGYIVLYPNPRGSTTYGQEFGNVIQYHYPGDDYLDLMAGVDEVIRRGWADPDKLAVTGGSGGGVLTNWAIGHTDRFKAAVSMRSIADWRDFWYTADFSQFTPSWFRARRGSTRKISRLARPSLTSTRSRLRQC
jgi:dipeptidyl aminopeptidase/acylaminoacyl peptidase